MTMTEKTEKRVTLTADRFTIDCSLCGFVSSEKSLSDALSSARNYAKRHNSPEEKITVFDVMAHEGVCHLWDVQGNCLEKKPFSHGASAMTLESEIMGKYPTEWIELREKTNLPDAGVIPAARITAKESPIQVGDQVKVIDSHCNFFDYTFTVSEIREATGPGFEDMIIGKFGEIYRTFERSQVEKISPSPEDDRKKERAVSKYPRVLTMEQYERDWKPKGWNLLPIGPTATYRKEWDIWEAIRDIVQNALDESESYTSGYDEDSFWVEDQGRGIGIQNFLLGPPKLKEEWARGKFGEGMKLAGLALLRLGYAVRVETAGREVFLIFVELEAERHRSVASCPLAEVEPHVRNEVPHHRLFRYGL